jgi:uncharacterized integral membrane protein (TIGR00697 family)
MNTVNYKYLPQLHVLYYIIFIATMIMGYKVASLGSLMQAPGTAVIFTFTFFFCSIVTEVYGYQAMRRLIWLTIIYAIIFSVITVIISLLPAPKFWHADIAYGHIVLHVFHFSVAIAVGFIISNFVNAYIIAQSKIKLHGRFFWLRCFLAATIAELSANSVSLLITLFGNWDVSAALDMFAQAYVYKFFYALVCCTIASLVVMWLKKSETQNDNDKKTNFNPFIF